mgnify:CR=1 FL=1|jgi:predicted membrane channel-forming protein YqfA (hemolysin III family)|tara:strand:- start:328 stop:540 length:213 start_codon:yes stop_codon:yes gene_type:complete
MRKTAIYLIAGGTILLVLKFITIILKFLTSHPLIGLGIVIIVAGIILFLLDIYQENQRSKGKETFRGITK